MIRNLALILPMLLASPAMAQQFGKPLTLKEETKVSEIMAKPDAYNGKLVKVSGTVTDVCPHKGCYIIIASDQRFQSIQFKVDDGVIVFPANLKGKKVVAEGTVFKWTQDGDDAVKIRINGLGAVASE
jgi:hypothetical protein